MKTPAKPPIALVTAADIAAVGGTWVDQGNQIKTEGFDFILLWVEFTQNDSTTNQIQVLSQHTLDGTEHVMETANDYQKTLGDADIDIVYPFELDDSIPFVQVQSVAAALGATTGTISIRYTLGNRS